MWSIIFLYGVIFHHDIPVWCYNRQSLLSTNILRINHMQRTLFKLRIFFILTDRIFHTKNHHNYFVLNSFQSFLTLSQWTLDIASTIIKFHKKLVSEYFVSEANMAKLLKDYCWDLLPFSFSSLSVFLFHSGLFIKHFLIFPSLSHFYFFVLFLFERTILQCWTVKALTLCRESWMQLSNSRSATPRLRCSHGLVFESRRLSFWLINASGWCRSLSFYFSLTFPPSLFHALYFFFSKRTQRDLSFGWFLCVFFFRECFTAQSYIFLSTTISLPPKIRAPINCFHTNCDYHRFLGSDDDLICTERKWKATRK